jgi:hypothetical protein
LWYVFSSNFVWVHVFVGAILTSKCLPKLFGCTKLFELMFDIELFLQVNHLYTMEMYRFSVRKKKARLKFHASKCILELQFCPFCYV